MLLSILPVIMSKYKFNREQLSFVEEKLGILGTLKMVFRYLLGTVLLAVIYYLVFALLFNTTQEERLIRENEILNAEYQRSLEKLGILDEVLTDLKTKDREIYKSIFKSTPPDMLVEHNSGLYAQLDTSSDRSLVSFTADRIKFTEFLASEQTRRIESIYQSLSGKENITALPTALPIKGLSVSQTGAGVGLKIHPFYKTKENHTGLDLLAGLGTEVIATADGVIREVIRSDRGRGNQVRISHSDGIETYYAHLGEIFVRSGQKVSRGMVIARVGNSGLSFAPHLHYEVMFNGKVVDPVNFFFADLTPGDYREMMISALNSGQSLD